jgi:hypothetical protein
MHVPARKRAKSKAEIVPVNAVVIPFRHPSQSNTCDLKTRA